jgi:hypothetical protein
MRGVTFDEDMAEQNHGVNDLSPYAFLFWMRGNIELDPMRGLSVHC